MEKLVRGRKPSFWKVLAQSFLCLVVLTGATLKANAQADQGAIVGYVKDSTGAVIPNAEVTLTNPENGLVLKATSDSSGSYVFSPIKIGTYSVEAGAPGFTSSRQEGIQLHVQDRIEVNLDLKTGSQTTEVTVTTGPALLHDAGAATVRRRDRRT